MNMGYFLILAVAFIACVLSFVFNDNDNNIVAKTIKSIKDYLE